MKSLIDNPDSNIVIKDEKTAPILNIILQCPKEYSGMGNMIGLQYNVLKDFVSWNTPEGYSKKDMQKRMMPVLLNYGSHLATLVNSK